MRILQGCRPLTASEVDEERIRIQKTGHALYNEAGEGQQSFPASSRDTVHRSGHGRSHRRSLFWGPECQWERVVIWIFFFTEGEISKASGIRLSRYLRQLPRNIVLCAQTFTTFLQRSKVARCHRTRATSRRSGNG